MTKIHFEFKIFINLLLNFKRIYKIDKEFQSCLLTCQRQDRSVTELLLCRLHYPSVTELPFVLLLLGLRISLFLHLKMSAKFFLLYYEVIS